MRNIITIAKRECAGIFLAGRVCLIVSS